MRAIGLTSNVEVSMAYGATIVPWRSIHFPLLFSSLLFSFSFRENGKRVPPLK
jgi:hypothetical protein